MKLDPEFEDLNSSDPITKHIETLVQVKEATPHDDILNKLLEQFDSIDFKALAFPKTATLKKDLEKVSTESDEAKEIHKKLDKYKLSNKHYLVLSIDKILAVAQNKKWNLCKNHDFIYLFNGAYWSNIDKEDFQKFLGEAAEKIGVETIEAKYFQFRENIYKQFLATAYLTKPNVSKDKVLINLKNGTFEIGPKGTKLRPFNAVDFLTYQLPFKYNPQAKAPLFQTYLDRVLPNIDLQKILAEYLGFVFIKNNSSSLKEEKALILYGSGANGKSVFFEIVNALLGLDNVSHFSLQSLTDQKGYHRAKLANKLVNYASEINGKLEAATFKQLVSGEPIEARLPYGSPFILKQYAKLIFNCNELPKDVEHTNAFFRRFLIIPFEVTIPKEDQDKQLHTKIIDKELSGVFNWVLDGLNRLLDQKKFTDCEAVTDAVNQYRVNSDSVQLFLQEKGYTKSVSKYVKMPVLFIQYKTFCIEDNYKPVSKTNFKKRLEAVNILIEKKNIGNIAYLSINQIQS
jgi:putative DNA primase/helicase